MKTNLLAALLGGISALESSPFQEEDKRSAPEIQGDMIREFTDQYYWPSAQGDIRVSCMEESHIKNTMIMIHNKAKAARELGIELDSYGDLKNEEWMVIFHSELKAREFYKLAKEWRAGEKTVERRKAANLIANNELTEQLTEMKEALEEYINGPVEEYTKTVEEEFLFPNENLGNVDDPEWGTPDGADIPQTNMPPDNIADIQDATE